MLIDEDTDGIEPKTSCVPSKGSTNWAKSTLETSV